MLKYTYSTQPASLYVRAAAMATIYSLLPIDTAHAKSRAVSGSHGH